MAITTRSAAALGLGLMLAGCGEPTIAWRSAQSPDHRYTATVEYDAPVLERKVPMCSSNRAGSSRAASFTRAHLRDCVILKWPARER